MINNFSNDELEKIEEFKNSFKDNVNDYNDFEVIDLDKNNEIKINEKKIYIVKDDGDIHISKLNEFGTAEGNGIYYFSNGDKFIGKFISGMLCEGTYYFSNGEKFEGNFYNNKKKKRKILFF